MALFRRIAAFSVLAILVWCAVGVIVYPQWWYEFIFEGNFRNPEYWEQGNYVAFLNAFSYLFPIVLTAWIVLAFSRTQVPENLVSFNAKFKLWVSSKRGAAASASVLTIVFGLGLATSGLRSVESRQLEAQIAKSRKDLEAFQEKLKGPQEEPPLSEPTSFSYIDPKEVDSLYGQYEPDLVPALVREKIETSAHLEAGASIEEYLKTNAGISKAKAVETELRETEKNPQRKLRDLLRFLYDQGKLKRYGHQRWKSDELQKLEDATALLSKYGVVADSKKLQSVRDRLLAEEVRRLGDELSVLHGLVLVEGDWVVDRLQDSYRFRAPVVEQISNPLYFEARVRSAELSSKTEDIIGNVNSRPIRLSVFGNVVAGASPQDRSVHIAPIAIF